MAWQQINPSYVRQDFPGLRAAWYRETSSRVQGDLMLWTDPLDRVVAFKLSHEEWPSLRQHHAEWRLGKAPAVESQRAERLLDYFHVNATALRPEHRRQIQYILSEGAA